MAFDRLVGEAYILLRGNGKLLKRDFERASKNAGKDVGKDFEEQLSKSIERRVTDLSRRLARAYDTGSFDAFIAKGESANDAVKRLRRELNQFGKSAGVSDAKMKMLNRRFEDWAKSVTGAEDAQNALSRTLEQDKAWKTYASNLDPVGQKISKVKANLDGLGDSIAQAAAKDDWSKLRGKGESIDDMQKRMTASLQKWNAEGRLNSDRMEMLNSSMTKWASSVRDSERAVKSSAEQLDKKTRSVSFLDEGVKRMRENLDGMKNDFVKGFSTLDFSHMQKSGETTADTVDRLKAKLESAREQGSLAKGDFDRLHESVTKWGASVETTSESHRRLSSRIDDTSRRTSSFADVIGRGFGKGGRNDFLNFIGGAVSGLIKLGTALPMTLIARVTALGESFSDAFSDARSAGLGVFTASVKGLGGALSGGTSGLAATAIAALAAIGLLGAALPVMAAALSLAAGAVTALASSITIGLIGALLPLVPLLTAGALGFGAIAIAAAKWAKTDKGEAMVSKLKKSLDDLGQKSMPAFDRVANRVFPGVTSLIESFGDSAGATMSDLASKLEDPRMNKFYAAWGESLPRIFESLGRGINSLLVGFIAFFTPILPYAEKLATGFQDMADRFSKWASSADGQNKIADFMDKAWTAAVTLKDILGEVWNVLSTIFTSGNENAGQNFLDKLLEKLEKFSEWLKSPEGQAAMKKWFEESKQFAGQLWDLMTKLGDAFDKLDSPEGRKMLDDVMGFLVMAGGYLASLAQLISLFGGLGSAIGSISWDGFSFGAQMATLTITIIMGTLEGLITWLTLWGTRLWTFLTAPFRAVYETLVGHSIVPDTVNEIVEWFTGLPGKLVTALVGLVSTLTQPFSDAWTAITGKLGEIGTTISTKLGEWKNTAVTKLGEWKDGAVGKFSEFKTSAAAKLEEFKTSASGKWESMKTTASSKLESLKTSAVSKLDSLKTSGVQKFEDMRSSVSSKLESMKTTASSKLESLRTTASSKFESVRTNAGSKLESMRATVQARFESMRSQAGSKLDSLRTSASSKWESIRTNAGSKLESMRSTVSSKFETMRSQAGTKLEAISSKVRGWGITGAVRSAVSGVTSALTSPFSSAASTIGGIIAGISSSISNLLGTAAGIAGSIRSTLSSIRMPTLSKPSWMASGGIEYGPRIVGVGEAGPEAIVPLSRPLSMVDPSVRGLSAFAQGLKVPGGGGGTTDDHSRSVTIEAGAISVSVPNSDPELAAQSVLDRIITEIH